MRTSRSVEPVEHLRQVNSSSEPLLPWRQPDRGSHAVQFFTDDALLIDELCAFIGGALLSGSAAIVIATKAHRESLSQRLEARGLDIARVVEQGHYIPLDAAQTLASFMRNGWPDERLFTETMARILEPASRIGLGKISAFGEMVALLWADGKSEAAVRVEQLWNNLPQKYALNLRCAYPMQGFGRGDSSFLKICGEHTHIITDENSVLVAGEELRKVADLQQEVQALAAELAQGKLVEANLRQTKSELESTVGQRTSVLRQLSARLLKLQDVERRRIARELHDSLGQYLVGLKLNMDMVRRSPTREDLWVEVDQLMNQCIGEVRTLSYLLHPPTMDAAGFVSAARWFVEGFSQRSGVKVTLDAPDNLGRLPDPIELALFRVLQEALTNVHRHSGASEAYVVILQDSNRVVLEVKDNGRGMPIDILQQFDETGAGTGVGLGGIRERARELGGKLTLEATSKGTLLKIAVPHRSKVQLTDSHNRRIT
jgi:signal transduction histidine kinase